MTKTLGTASPSARCHPRMALTAQTSLVSVFWIVQLRSSTSQALWTTSVARSWRLYSAKFAQKRCYTERCVENNVSSCGRSHRAFQGSFTVDTQRVLKTILPSDCLWTGLRDVEGFKYDQTLEELKSLFPCGDDSMEDDAEGEGLLPPSVPESIRQMASDRCSMEALGDMIWCATLTPLRTNL